jgi:hypothetical protein
MEPMIFPKACAFPFTNYNFATWPKEFFHLNQTLPEV